DKQPQNDHRKDISHVETDGSWELDPLARVRFLQEIFKSPSVPAGAEQQVYQASDRKEGVADDKVLQILDRAPRSQRLDMAPYVEAQHAGHGKKYDDDRVPGD